ncbi:S8 family serine peptidase [Halobacillus sp. A1]|uniref:S8 family serine peptidase n=1 Tax=Halobacillus sp. A1 TaxID=2880262 RepID=UPI0020A6B256|nr:S8 family serine peptidase [Halobacillus sp. A1]MCP3031454.1 S8 family serine peptidase [Halobacillus sp. A1]
MKKLIVICMFILFISYVFSDNQEVSASIESTDEKQRVIIGFEEKVEEDVLSEIPYDLHHTYDSFNAIAVSLPVESISNLERQPEVKWIESDQKVSANAQKIDWGYESINSNLSYDWGVTGEGVNVAVIDTGIDEEHPDLNIKGGKNFINSNSSYDDDNGHGTHVAGVIGAEDNSIGIIGVAPQANLYALKALDRDGEGWEAEIIAGIQWAVENKMDVINLSLTSCKSSEAMKKVLNEAENNGISVVAASGNKLLCNGEYLNDVMYPARYSSVISVGAVDRNKERALFSYGGDSLDFVAPGESIYSTYAGSQSGGGAYETLNGTSMAAPYVAGIVALHKQAFPELSLDDINDMMIEQSLDLGQRGKDFKYGHGLIQSLERPFLDMTANPWFEPYLKSLYSDHIIKGFPDGTFRPNSEISREEAITMVGRALGLDGKKRDSGFPDVSRDSYSSGYIASAEEKGIIEGFPSGNFEPDISIKRADIALIIHKAYEIEGDKSSNEYTDVADKFYASNAISKLSNEGIIVGYPDGTFRPRSNITRSEFTPLLAKADDAPVR